MFIDRRGVISLNKIMPLAKTDLQKIGSLLDSKLRAHPTKEYLDKKLKTYPTKEYLDSRLKAYPTKEYLDKKFRVELDPISKDIKKIQKDINMVIGFFDREYLELKSRVERIENFLKISPLT